MIIRLFIICIIMLMCSQFSYASLNISPSQTAIQSAIVCTDSDVETYVNSIKNSMYVTASETTENTLLLQMHYPSNSNNPSYRGGVYLYKIGSNSILASSSRNLYSSGGYLQDIVLNATSGDYYIKGMFRLLSDLDKACVVTSNSFNVENIVIPSINSVRVNQTSAQSGSTFTFSATLSNSLPVGYSIQVDFGGGYVHMSGSGTNYSVSWVVNTTGNNRPYTVRMRNSSNSVVDTASGTFTVTPLPEPHPPTISISSAATTATVGNSYSASLSVADVDGDLRDVQVNWGDGTTNSITNVTGSNDTASFTHVYSSSGNFTWNAIAHDHNDGVFSAGLP